MWVDCKPQKINELNDFIHGILNDLVCASITGPCDSYYHYNPVSNTCIRPVQSTRDWVYARDTYCYGYYRTKLITFSSNESLQWFDAWFKDEEFPMDCKFKSCKYGFPDALNANAFTTTRIHFKTHSTRCSTNDVLSFRYTYWFRYTLFQFDQTIVIN